MKCAISLLAAVAALSMPPLAQSSAGTRHGQYIVVFKPEADPALLDVHLSHARRVRAGSVGERLLNPPVNMVKVRHVYDGIFQGYSGSLAPATVEELRKREEVESVIEVGEARAEFNDYIRIDFADEDDLAEVGESAGETQGGTASGQAAAGPGGVTTVTIQAHPTMDPGEADDDDSDSLREVIKEPNSAWNAVRISHRNYAGMYARGDWVHNGYLGQGVTVYVLDSGIDIHHPAWRGFRVVQGPNFVIEQTEEDNRGHGTFCTSVITGPLGFAPKATVVAVKVVRDDGGSSEDDLLAGFDYVLKQPGENELKVINFSSYAYADKPNLFSHVIERLMEKGVHFVGSAGNDGRNSCETRTAWAKVVGVEGTPIGPILVGSVNGFNRIPNEEDGDSVMSNVGACVTVYAPGSAVPVLSANMYDMKKKPRGWGTSIAAPQVAAVIAAKLSQTGPVSPARMIEWLRRTATEGAVENGTGTELVLFNGVSSEGEEEGEAGKGSFW